METSKSVVCFSTRRKLLVSDAPRHNYSGGKGSIQRGLDIRDRFSLSAFVSQEGDDMKNGTAKMVISLNICLLLFKRLSLSLLLFF